MSNGVKVFVGDFGLSKISEDTLSAYRAECALGKDKRWRKSSRRRQDVDSMFRDLHAVQRYFWLKGEKVDSL